MNRTTSAVHRLAVRDLPRPARGRSARGCGYGLAHLTRADTDSSGRVAAVWHTGYWATFAEIADCIFLVLVRFSIQLIMLENRPEQVEYRGTLPPTISRNVGLRSAICALCHVAALFAVVTQFPQQPL